MLRLTLSDPRLEAGDAPDRLVVTCDYQVNGSLGMTLAGRVGFSTELGYDSGRRAVVMSHPRIDQLDWQGMEALAGSVRNLINFALGKFLNDYPLYCLPPRQPRFVGVELEIIGIAVISGELRLRLRPASISA